MGRRAYGDWSRADGLAWHVVLDDTPLGAYVGVDRSRGPWSQESGFVADAPPAPGDVDAWNGVTDGLPPFVLVRAAADVLAVTVVTASGEGPVVDLVETDGACRVGAVPVDDGAIVGLRIRTAAGEHERALHAPPPGAPGH